jgi:hypothetical protein
MKGWYRLESLPKLKPSIKKRWLKALRSGKYQQGTNSLQTIEDGIAKFCCLGVLRDIIKDDKGYKGDGWGVDPYGTILTHDVVQYVLADDIGDDEPSSWHRFCPLIIRNDGNHPKMKNQQSFDMIADHIEKYM